MLGDDCVAEMPAEGAAQPDNWRGHPLPTLKEVPSLDADMLKTLMQRFCGLDDGGGLSVELMRRAVAWHVQFRRACRRAEGPDEDGNRLSPREAERIVLAAEGRTNRQAPVNSKAILAPGTRLVREWRGTIHEVIVQSDGTFLWQGKAWRSLSTIANTITGSIRSGPRFFGLVTGKTSKGGANG